MSRCNQQHNNHPQSKQLQDCTQSSQKVHQQVAPQPELLPNQQQLHTEVQKQWLTCPDMILVLQSKYSETLERIIALECGIDSYCDAMKRMAEQHMRVQSQLVQEIVQLQQQLLEASEDQRVMNRQIKELKTAIVDEMVKQLSSNRKR